MAYAIKYNEWFDPELAEKLDPEEVEKWDQKQFLLDHTRELFAQIILWQYRHEHLPHADHPVLSAEIRKRLWGSLTWNCKRVFQSAVNDIFHVASAADIDLPDGRSAEGKQLAKASVNLDIREWLVMRRDKLESELRYCVTISRTKAERPPKPERSESNHATNCLDSELINIRNFIIEYDSLPRPAGVPHPEENSVDS